MYAFIPIKQNSRRWRGRSAGRRGVTLAAMLIIAPLALAIFVLVFTRLEVQRREVARMEERVQARHLAESALLEWLTQTSSTHREAISTDAPADDGWQMQLERALSPQNSYQIHLSPNPDERQIIRCKGVVATQKIKGPPSCVSCLLTARISDNASAPDILSIKYHRD